MGRGRGHGPIVPRWSMPKGSAQRPTWPTTSLVYVICKVAPLGVITTLDPCRFDPRMEVELPWIHGPTIIHLEGPNQPSYRLTYQSNLPTYLQPPSRGHPSPLDGEAVQWMVGRPWPMSPGGQVTPNCLIFAYKYPHALYTL